MRLSVLLILSAIFSFACLASSALAQERQEGSKIIMQPRNGEGGDGTLEPVSPYTEFAVRSKGPGLFWPWRVGASVALGFPHVLTYGLEVMYHQHVSGLISFGDFDLNSDDVKIGLSNWDVRGRWHIWAGSAFVGLAYGSQSLTGSISEDIVVSGTRVPTTLTMDVVTTYATPHGGFHWVWDTGLALGAELGLQVPIDNDVEDIQTRFAVAENAADTREYGELRDELRKGVRAFSRAQLPYLAIRAGWLL